MEENRDKLTVLTVTTLNEALNRYVDRSDTDAFENIVKYVHQQFCFFHQYQYPIYISKAYCIFLDIR